MATMDWRLRSEDVSEVSGRRTRVERSWEVEVVVVVDSASALRRARLWVKGEALRPAADEDEDINMGAISAGIFCSAPQRRSGGDVCARPRQEDGWWHQVAVALDVVVNGCFGLRTAARLADTTTLGFGVTSKAGQQAADTMAIKDSRGGTKYERVTVQEEWRIVGRRRQRR